MYAARTVKLALVIISREVFWYAPTVTCPYTSWLCSVRHVACPCVKIGHRMVNQILSGAWSGLAWHREREFIAEKSTQVWRTCFGLSKASADRTHLAHR